MESEHTIVPVITGALGTIKKSGVQNVQLLPGHPSAIELQKFTLMSTAHSIRKVLGLVALITTRDLNLPEERHPITNRRINLKFKLNNNNVLDTFVFQGVAFIPSTVLGSPGCYVSRRNLCTVPTGLQYELKGGVTYSVTHSATHSVKY